MSVEQTFRKFPPKLPDTLLETARQNKDRISTEISKPLKIKQLAEGPCNQGTASAVP
jgi:hypothetical protein